MLGGETMLLEENIFLNVSVGSKEELLELISKKAVELNIASDQNGLLRDLKKREEEFATGLQDGFAIPHARSSYVQKPSILYFKTNKALEWGSMDDKKVNCVFSLLAPAENEGNIHLLMLSQLATCLLEEDFKEYVKVANDTTQLTAFIKKRMEEQ